MTRIAILSDSHGLLTDAVRAELAAADCIIHAGDVDTPAALAALRVFGSVHIVRGNNDWSLARELPERLRLTVEGVRFFVVHDRRAVPRGLADADVVVFGHSHRYCEERRGGVLWLNPGSCGWRRYDPALTLCRMTVEAGRIRCARVEVPRAGERRA